MILRIKNKKLRDTLNKSSIRFYPKIPQDNRILFHLRDEEYNFMRIDYNVPVMIDRVFWATVVHYYESIKSIDSDYKESIRKAKTPNVARVIGSKVVLGDDFNVVKVMEYALICKFFQYDDMADLLVSTKNSILVNDDPDDFYWGAGDGTGKNELGIILMSVRTQIIILRNILRDLNGHF